MSVQARRYCDFQHIQGKLKCDTFCNPRSLNTHTYLEKSTPFRICSSLNRRRKWCYVRSTHLPLTSNATHRFRVSSDRSTLFSSTGSVVSPIGLLARDDCNPICRTAQRWQEGMLYYAPRFILLHILGEPFPD